MTNRKFYWIVLPLSIALLGSLAINVMGWRFVKQININQGSANIQNAKFTTTELKKLRNHLNNGEIEEAQSIIDLLYKIETMRLEVILSPDLYPEPMIQYTKKVLAETKLGFDPATEINEKTDEESN